MAPQKNEAIKKMIDVKREYGKNLKNVEDMETFKDVIKTVKTSKKAKVN